MKQETTAHPGGGKKPGVQSSPFTRYGPDFVPHRQDFAKAWAQTRFRDRVKDLVGLLLHTRIMRAYARFSEANGKILAAGISYMALFSLTAGVTLGGMVFSALLDADGQLRDAVGEAVNEWLPGLVKTASTPDGLVNPQVLAASPGTSVASIIVAAFLLYSATYVVASFSVAIRAMFGLAAVRERFLVAIGQRVIGLVALFVGILSTAALIVIGAHIHRRTTQMVPDMDKSWLDGISSTMSLLASLVINMTLMIILVRWVAGVRPLRSDLLWGSVIAGVGTTALRLLGTSVVSNVSGPILTAATTLITLIVWVNLQARVMLLAGAWMANPPRTVMRAQKASRKSRHRPNFATLSDPDSLVPSTFPFSGEDEANQSGPVTRTDSEPSPPRGQRSADPN